MCVCPTEDTASAHLSLVVLSRTLSSEGSSLMAQVTQPGTVRAPDAPHTLCTCSTALY